jgi:hypothetical protein
MAEPLKKAYRAEFWPVFLHVFVAGVGGTIGSSIARGRLSTSYLLTGILVGVVFSSIFTLIANACFPVYISPSGIRSYNSHGWYSHIAWSDITSVKKFNILGMQYLKVKKGKSQIIVPLFLSNKQQFYEDIEKYAGEDSKLFKALEIKSIRSQW